MSIYVDLICFGCKQPIIKLRRYVTFRLKGGHTNFYCKDCQKRSMVLDETFKETRQKRAKKKTNTIDTFWNRVDKALGLGFSLEYPNCWEWQGTLDIGGYGIFIMDHKRYQAHKLSYIVNIGNVNTGLLVLHHCDNRKCVNPEHLWLGTNKDNSDDKVQKKRHSHGETSKSAKLKIFQVLEIRKSLEEGQTITQLALKYKVTVWTIYNIKYKRRWKSI